MNRLLWGILIALITVSMLWPAEEAYGGAGLHWVVLWLLAGCLAAAHTLWQSLGHSETAPGSVRRGTGWTWTDSGWLLIVFGQWVSTRSVFQAAGDRRSALNLSFEWLGLLVAAVLVRAAVVHPLRRRQLLVLLLSLSAGLSIYAVTQHHATYATRSAWYRTLRTELDALTRGADPRGVVRITEIQREFQQNEIPLEGAARVLWEQRLLNSSEPTGTFALANTLAGILAAAVVVLAGTFLRRPTVSTRSPMTLRILAGLCCVLMAYALVLTKSRTGWIGCAAGLGWLILTGRHQLGVTRRGSRGLLVAAFLILMSVVAFAGFAGALDREVILESPRSLQFRLLYWAGTAGLLKQNPVFGVGPGNFRQGYLPHKLPESSEEIRDPHNLVLEAWTSGGLLSLAGVLLCGAALLKQLFNQFFRRKSDISEAESAESTGTAGRSPILRSSAERNVPTWSLIPGLVGGFALHAAWSWLNGNDLASDDLYWLLIPLFAGLCLILKLETLLSGDRAVACGAALALGLHLQGAGGFQTPIVMLWLLILLKIAESNDQLNTKSAGVGRLPMVLNAGFSAAACATGVVVVVVWGLIPVHAARQLVSAARSSQIQGNVRAASALYQDAGQRDRLAVLPRQRLVALESYKLQNLAADGDSTAETLAAEFQAAMTACDDYLAADVRDVAAWRERGEIRGRMAIHTGNRLLLQLAVEDMRQVVRMYPSSATNWLLLFRISAAGSTLDPELQKLADQAAREALRIDEINHTWGHSDKYLSDEQLMELGKPVREP